MAAVVAITDVVAVTARGVIVVFVAVTTVTAFSTGGHKLCLIDHSHGVSLKAYETFTVNPKISSCLCRALIRINCCINYFILA